MKTILSALQIWTKKLIKKNTPDWNQNDPNGDGYIKNRPFYEKGEKHLFQSDSETVTIDSDGGYQQLSSPLPTQFEVGKTYIVTFNGEQYTCVAWQGNEGEAICIGNGDIYGGAGNGNGEPFSCDSYLDGEWYLNVQFAGTYTIAVTGQDGTGNDKDYELKKIDGKFLPDLTDLLAEEVVRPDYDIYDENAVGYIKNRPCYYDGIKIEGANFSVGRVGMGGTIGRDAVHNHVFIPGCKYHVVGEIGVKYDSYGVVSWPIDLMAQSVESGVYFDLGGLSFKTTYTLPMNSNIYIELDGITNFSSLEG
jgi:hypothetical protein